MRRSPTTEPLHAAVVGFDEHGHLCVHSRGVNDTSSATLTSEYGGEFATDAALRFEFLRQIGK